MKVVRRYLPAGLINPSLSPSLCCAEPTYTANQPPRTIIERWHDRCDSPSLRDLSTRRPREAHNFGFIAISLDPFHWRSVNNPVKRRACFPIGWRTRFRYSMDRRDTGWLVIAGISSARMTSRRSFILVITRYASALDNEMCAVVKRGARTRHVSSRSCRTIDRGVDNEARQRLWIRSAIDRETRKGNDR